MDDIRLMGETDRKALTDLLASDPVQNLFLLGMLEEHGMGGHDSAHAFYALPAEGAPRAVVLVSRSGLWVPSVPESRLAQQLGSALKALPMLSSVGERAAVDALWISHGGPARRPRLARLQRLLQLTPDDMGPWITSQLRPARPEDLPQLAEASALMQRDDLGVDPRGIDAAAHERRCLERIHTGRSWVLFENGQLVFKADVGVRSRWGAQVEGVYTAEGSRHRGIATKGLGQLCRTLLSGLPRLTLHADAGNEPALGLYRKLGFTPQRELRLLISE
ncbi:MAG TPA: GNAT family N-acetyltransferase [Myxococcales bacterium]|nr:GNAT family N-acetyltransferase [Myxococcales bacterium]